ncbi:MAG: hypothetical protein M1823_001825 [Watsoniomyces obsoletus]|nr:MAG: hypothetical protein M1823_001825 [Watsoniomyces obsoletus]
MPIRSLSRCTCNGIPSIIKTQSFQSRRTLSTAPPDSNSVAIVGGGITGLVAAYRLLKHPHWKGNITLYEKSHRLGGWLNTKSVNIGDGTVVFEQGPRSLRTKGVSAQVTKYLIRTLDLKREVLATPKDAPGARNRYVYGPDHLVRVPGPGDSLFSIFSVLLREPLFKGSLHGVMGEYFRPRRSPEIEDESVGSFISRRFNSSMADNLVSAFLHGIYAGDVYQLSIKSLFPQLWNAEATAGGSVGLFLKLGSKYRLMRTTDVRTLQKLSEVGGLKSERYDHAVQFTFRGGLRTLSRTLTDKLRMSERVKINTGTEIKRISLHGSRERMNVVSSVGSRSYSHVISTLLGKASAQVLRPTIPSLATIPSVSVMVVNLYFDNPRLLPVRGFGYLIPRSIPLPQNPERALGVVFDSDAVSGLDTMSGTKVTVMLGGHWWDHWPKYPDEEEGASMARAVLQRHLGIKDEPRMINVSLQQDAIPQYVVGHHARMANAHHELLHHFQGRLCVAGNSYTGVSVHDCVSAGWDVATSVGNSSLGNSVNQTGLESFVRPETWMAVRRDQWPQV